MPVWSQAHMILPMNGVSGELLCGMKSVQIKVECGQSHKMAEAFGAPLLGILLANSAKLFSAPEGRRKLAGGGAKRNHRDRSKKIVRVPAGTPDQNSQQDQSRSGALSGREVLSCRFRWLRFAPPPANFPRASGALGVCQQYRLESLLIVFGVNLHASVK